LEQYLSVSALTKYIKAKLEGDKHLFSILLKGEISNFKRHSRGHLYFSLKDENASISAIMFAKDASTLIFSPKEGDHVLLKGRISLYEPTGSYSIQVIEMKQDGIGELYLKYEKLKKELEEKGYFRLDRKREIPKFPKKIGVITSPTGAVIEDIKNTISRRYLLTEIHLYPALVQGSGSSESICKQIAYANMLNEVDLLIVGRGGGSIEDLWSFNDILVIDAIYNSKIPIITAIGHETDYTLSDFVSDLRAPTPTAAAELATPNKIDLLEKINESINQIEYKINEYFNTRKRELVFIDQRLDMLSPNEKLRQLKINIDQYQENLYRNYLHLINHNQHLLENISTRIRNPLDIIKNYFEKLKNIDEKIAKNIHQIIDYKNYRFDKYRSNLNALNPLALMDKGFGVITKNDQIVTSIHDIDVDDLINLRLKDGSVDTKVIRKKVI
jgi:exodeoxyribonuclease VII large subunit